MTRAMILAAGFGTRLGALSDVRPKPLLPMCDVPLIRYPLALLRAHGVREVVVNLHHHGDMIRRELGDGSDADVRVVYSPEANILGTGGGIRRALPLLGDGAFFVANGKVVADVDLCAVLALHRSTGAAATLVVRPDADAKRWGAIDAPPGGGRIRGLLGEGSYMFTGIHVLEPELVARLPDDGTPRCIVRDGYVPWLAEGVPLSAYVYRGYFGEHSTPERYVEGNVALLRNPGLLSHPPAPLTGVDPTANVDPSVILRGPLRIGAGATIGPGTVIGPDTVIGHGARIAAGLTLARTIVWPDTVVTAPPTSSIVGTEISVG